MEIHSKLTTRITIHMTDDSVLACKITITMDTDDRHSIAHNNINTLMPYQLEGAIVHLLCDPSSREDSDDEDPVDILTAADYPECAQ